MSRPAVIEARYAQHATARVAGESMWPATLGIARRSPKAAQRLRVRTSKLSPTASMGASMPNQRLMNGVSPGVGRQLARFMKPAAFIQPRHSLGSHGEELGALQNKAARWLRTGQPTRAPEGNPHSGDLEGYVLVPSNA